MKILTLITTYNRPQLCRRLAQRLIEEIQADAENEHEVLLIDDASDTPYVWDVVCDLQDNRIKAYGNRFGENNGKEGYWLTVELAMMACRFISWDILVQLPDDVTPVPGMYQKIVECFNTSQPQVVNLYRCHRDAQWGSAEPKPHNDVLREAGWMDMCYAASRDVFHQIGFTVEPVNRDWKRHPELGSGVGAQLSRRIREEGIPIYQFLKSVVIDDGEQESKMNPNRNFKFKTL